MQLTETSIISCFVLRFDFSILYLLASYSFQLEVRASEREKERNKERKREHTKYTSYTHTYFNISNACIHSEKSNNNNNKKVEKELRQKKEKKKRRYYLVALVTMKIINTN